MNKLQANSLIRNFTHHTVPSYFECFQFDRDSAVRVRRLQELKSDYRYVLQIPGRSRSGIRSQQAIPHLHLKGAQLIGEALRVNRVKLSSFSHQSPSEVRV